MKDYGDEHLDERLRIRVFPEMMTKIEETMAAHERWENKSHFFRAAAAHFLNFIDEGGIE